MTPFKAKDYREIDDSLEEENVMTPWWAVAVVLFFVMYFGVIYLQHQYDLEHAATSTPRVSAPVPTYQFQTVQFLIPKRVDSAITAAEFRTLARNLGYETARFESSAKSTPPTMVRITINRALLPAFLDQLAVLANVHEVPAEDLEAATHAVRRALETP